METNTTQPPKRPKGMTILLVLSLINACWNILSATIMFLTMPIMTEMMQNGQVEEMLAPFSNTLNEEMREAMTASMNMMTQISPKYWLILALLFVGSLVGVIRMFKYDKIGFHIYSISQILMLINASAFLYPKQPQSGFVSDLLLTLIFILLYYLYFKRMEMMSNPPQNPEQS